MRKICYLCFTEQKNLFREKERKIRQRNENMLLKPTASKESQWQSWYKKLTEQAFNYG